MKECLPTSPLRCSGYHHLVERRGGGSGVPLPALARLIGSLNHEELALVLRVLMLVLIMHLAVQIELLAELIKCGHPGLAVAATLCLSLVGYAIGLSRLVVGVMPTAVLLLYATEGNACDHLIAATNLAAKRSRALRMLHLLALLRAEVNETRRGEYLLR